jgi:hypothetical protein
MEGETYYQNLQRQSDEWLYAEVMTVTGNCLGNYQSYEALRQFIKRFDELNKELNRRGIQMAVATK